MRVKLKRCESVCVSRQPWAEPYLLTPHWLWEPWGKLQRFTMVLTKGKYPVQVTDPERITAWLYTAHTIQKNFKLRPCLRWSQLGSVSEEFGERNPLGRMVSRIQVKTNKQQQQKRNRQMPRNAKSLSKTTSYVVGKMAETLIAHVWGTEFRCPAHT